MLKRIVAVASALALATLPIAGTATVSRLSTSPISLTYTYSLGINADCTLAQSPGGNFAFQPVSGLLGPGSNSSDATAINTVTTKCSANTASLFIFDAANTGTTEYDLTMGTNVAKYVIGQQNCYNCMYTNSSTTGISLDASGGTQNRTLVGYLATFGGSVKPPGSYSDTITLEVTFS